MATRRVVRKEMMDESPVFVEQPKKGLLERYAPAMAVLLVVAAFALGSLWTKVKYLESGTKVNPTAAGNNAPVVGVPSKYKSFDEAMKDVAKQAGADGDKLVKCVNSGSKKAIVDAETAEGSKVGVQGTPAFFINGRLLAGAYPFDEFKKIIDEELSGKADPKITRASVSIGNSLIRGTSGAKVTIVEYSDFQCPFCARSLPTVEQVLKEYSEKVAFAYKHFPLSQIHPHAQKAAEAAECAKDQGKFWEMHDKLFATQADWSGV